MDVLEFVDAVLGDKKLRRAAGARQMARMVWHKGAILLLVVQVQLSGDPLPRLSL